MAAESAIVIDHGPRLAQLERDTGRLGDAIAKGLLSDTLAARLTSAEAELRRVRAERAGPLPPPHTLSEESIEHRRAEILKSAAARRVGQAPLGDVRA